jgi:hypothetical protein
MGEGDERQAQKGGDKFGPSSLLLIHAQRALAGKGEARISTVGIFGEDENEEALNAVTRTNPRHNI